MQLSGHCIYLAGPEQIQLKRKDITGLGVTMTSVKPLKLPDTLPRVELMPNNHFATRTVAISVMVL